MSNFQNEKQQGKTLLWFKATCGDTHEDRCSSSVSINESTSSSCLRLDIISFLNLIGSMDFINQIIVNRTPTKHRIQSRPLVVLTLV